MTTWLHRFSIRPRHRDAYLDLWPDEMALRAGHGFTVRRAFVQEHAEPKLTYLYEHADPAANDSYEASGDVVALRERAAPHVFRNTLTRQVRVELLTPPAVSPEPRIAILRRYSIVGDWQGFLGIWRQIVPIRERYGFRALFAVVDEPKDMFTWAFDHSGSWDDLDAAQEPYYADPDRAALRNVFDYMADYTVDPATILL